MQSPQRLKWHENEVSCLKPKVIKWGDSKVGGIIVIIWQAIPNSHGMPMQLCCHSMHLSCQDQYFYLQPSVLHGLCKAGKPWKLKAWTWIIWWRSDTAARELVADAARWVQGCPVVWNSNKGFHRNFETVVDLLAWLLRHVFLKKAVTSYRCESCVWIFSMGKLKIKI